MTPLALFILLLSACNGCNPRLPTDADKDSPKDTSPPPDSGETGETADTSPPLPNRCDNLEVEPNDSLDLSQAITMEEWWCGTFVGEGTLGDPEFMHFATQQAGWVAVSAEAASRGSAADAQFLFYDDDGHSVFVYDGLATSDPKIVVPTEAVGDFGVVMAETGYLTGDTYSWALLASQVKPPVTWTFEESEDNDAAERANAFELGATVFAKMGDTADKDWFHISVPVGLQAVTFTVEAFGAGAPVDMQLRVYEDGVVKKACYHGVVDYDLDPDCELKVTTSHEYDVLMEDEFDAGSSFNWYTVTIVGIAEDAAP